MDKQEKDNNMHICAGLLAHVDAGKTTLSEAMLYRSGSIRNLGRVDHQNAFLDYDELERNQVLPYMRNRQLCIGNSFI